MQKEIEKWKNNFISLLEFYVSAEILNNPMQREEMEHKFLSQLPSLLELLAQNIVDESVKIMIRKHDGETESEDAFNQGVTMTLDKASTLIHEAQSSLK